MAEVWCLGHKSEPVGRIYGSGTDPFQGRVTVVKNSGAALILEPYPVADPKSEGRNQGAEGAD